MIIAHDHISVISEDQINTICNPLFQNTTISYFVYLKVYFDGTTCVLTSNSKWHKYFWEKEYYKYNFIRLKSEYFYWKSHPVFKKISCDALEYFNIDNRLDIINKYDEYYEVFGFGTNGRDSEIINIYLNQKELLKKFTFYFKEQGQYLINKINKKENRLLGDKIKNYSLESCFLESCFLESYFLELENKKNQFYSLLNLKIENYIFGELLLTAKEFNILAYTLIGKSASEIGLILKLSPKTIESRLATLKMKFNSNNKQELIQNALTLDVVSFIGSVLQKN